MFRTKFRHLLVQYHLLAHHLHHLLKYTLFLRKNCEHKLLGIVDQCNFEMFIKELPCRYRRECEHVNLVLIMVVRDAT